MRKLTRRTFMAASSAALALPRNALAAPFVLKAGPTSLQILPKGENPTALLGFNGTTPGPELRVRQGDMLKSRFENATEQPSAIHWHGIRLRNAMDGVPGITQPLVQPGEAFDYVFIAPDAGTYWFHSHHRSWEQVAKGLYGTLIVEEQQPPQVDEDITVVLDDWRIDEAGVLMGGFGNMHDFAHAGRLGNNAMILPSQNRVRIGDRVRLRIVNTATARVFPIRLAGLEAQVVALDGMALAVPRPLADLRIAPAQRVDIIGDVTSRVEFFFVGRDALFDMGSLEIAGENPDPIGGKVGPLPPADVQIPNANPDHALTLKMEGGAMGGGHAGDDIWAFNDVSGLPQEPWASFRKGETAVIDLINDTRFEHGIHLHGHHFHELNPDGSPGDLRDTTLVEPGRSRKIAVVMDNPGKWLLHCHMLGHQASGLKTWVDVV